GLGDGGIDIVDPLRERIAQLRPDASWPRSALPKGRVLAIARSPTGDIWIGTQLGLFRADGAGRRVVRVDVPGRSPTAATWAIHLDEDRLWIGGLDGLWGLRAPAHGSLQLFARRDAGSLADQRVTFLCRATGHAIWVGTRAGLAHFDPETGTVERMPLDAPGRVGMPGGYISSVLTDRRGRLWVASFGNGLRIVTPSKGGAAPIIHRVDSREGLPNNGINAMLLDSNDDVWLSTDDGLVRIRSDDLSITALRSAEGVGIPSYWTTSAAIAPSGAMLFGGSSGLTIVNPHRLPSWQFVAPLVVTKVNGETHAVAVPQASGARGGNPVPRLALADPQRRDLLVEFSALDYSAPEQNLYAHRLLGFDKDWIVTDSTQRLARYTNLPPGDYMLELRGSNRVGLWSQPLRWPVHVGAAWYETGWFRAAAIALAVTAILGLVQARTLVLRRRARELERLVADRTVELEQRSAELRESETQLAQMAYYDGLTGLANRRMFNDDIKRQLALSQRGQPFTLLLIDLDRFKQINDTQGHDAGDIVLTTVGARLRGAVRDIDQLARLGGDEFAVLLARSGDRVAVDAVCRRIVDSLGVPVPHKGGLLRTGASIGAAICPHDANNEVDLYKAADLALYAAKRAGGNGWCWSRHEAVTT
ncbi:MAG: diguanylate cyclase, partial [Betaproteobacteria bacterium]